MRSSYLLVAGSDRVLNSLICANLSGPDLGVICLDPAKSKVTEWTKADVVVLDLGAFSPGLEGLYRTFLEGCRRSEGRLILLYDPPWPIAAISEFHAVKELTKPLSVDSLVGIIRPLL